MTHALLNNHLIIVLQATTDKNFSLENVYYICGSLATIIVALLVMQYAWFFPAVKKIKELKNAEFDYVLKNEIEYADYLIWTAEKGYSPYFNKMDSKDAISIYKEE